MQEIQEKNVAFLQQLKDEGGEVAIPKRAQMGLSKADLGNLMLKHRMPLMTITNGSSAHLKALACECQGVYERMSLQAPEVKLAHKLSPVGHRGPSHP